jgi:alanyl-tRNA synthetase
MMKDPLNAAWRGHSIEFCGGTHLSNTKDALSFSIVEEGGIAKGIRRISALTGDEALMSKKMGQAVEAQVARLDHLKDLDELERELKSLTQHLVEVDS